MPISLTDIAPAENEVDILILFHYADSPITGHMAELNRVTEGGIQRLLESQEFSGKKLEVAPLLLCPGVAAKMVLLVGLGTKDKFDTGVAFRACGAATKAISQRERGPVALYFPLDWTTAQQEAGVAGAMNGCSGQDLYKTKKGRHPLGEMQFSGCTKSSLESGEVLGNALLLTRRLVNEPADVIYPASFAAEAERVAKQHGLECEVWDEHRLTAEKCNALLAVGRASTRPARLVILRYSGGAKQSPPLALVGKGVTFDSGGLSLKPTDGMKTMKCDMAGAATVLGAMQAIAQLKLPVNVIGLCGLVENMVSGDSYKLGDVLHARNGKTIEVLNTDAEGRLVLADVLDVAVQQNPAKIIDLATLTGACLVALGTDVTGVMSNHDAWQSELLAAANSCGEPCWPLPMFPEYSEHIKSEIADIKNTGDGRWAGAIAGAKFLEEFVAGKPWIHLDIAGPAYLDAPKPWQEAGGTGSLLRTLVDIARKFGG